MIVSVVWLWMAMAFAFYAVSLYGRHRYAACLAMFMCASWMFIGSVAILWRVA